MSRLTSSQALERQVEKLTLKRENCERVLKGLNAVADVDGMEEAAKSLRASIRQVNDRIAKLKPRIRAARGGVSELE